ncbi:ankyrin [Hypoxylon cercidicola]|nr:ankyrin [Hypoxylon cercidicola]
MADPLSIAASIAGLVTLADVVYDRLTKYIKAVQNAAKEAGDLAKEINLLGGALNSLSRLARSLDNASFGNQFRMYHIDACSIILSDIEKKLKKFDNNSLKKKMMWPFSSGRVKEMLGDLSQHKQSINLALSANSMDLLLRCLAREEDLQKTASEIQANIEKTREVASRIHRDREREKVLRFFLKCNPQQNYEMSLRLRHPRTGTWLLRLPRFQTWLSTADEKLWLSGIPGAGKTVLAGTIIEAALAQCNENTAGAFFFCDYTDGKSQSPENIMGALAYQIAIQKEEAYAILEEYYCNLHPQCGLPHNPTVEALVKVVGNMVGLFDRVFLVVDGIDECGDLVPGVLQSLLDVSVDSENISIALLSRDEYYIRDCLEDGFVCETVAAHTEDVEEYVAAEIEERIRTKRLHIDGPELKGEIMQGLINGAKGMFRWVACQLDHLGECVSDESCRVALKELPPTLNETYLRILQRIPQDKAPLVQLVLHFIAFARLPLTIEQFREILAVPKAGSYMLPSDRVRESAIQKLCSSLIRKSNSGLYFEFAHFSVQEFLKDESLLKDRFEQFLISRSRSDRLMAVQCLNYLQLENFNQPLAATMDGIAYINQIGHDYPLYTYASYNWHIYAKDQYDDEDITHSAVTFFSYGKPAALTLWIVTLVLFLVHRDYKAPHSEYEEQILGVVSDLIHKDLTPLHMACLLSLPEVCGHLLKMGADIEQKSPLGTPMQCAVGMMTLFQKKRLSFNRITWDLRGCYSEKTVECLLEAGAKIRSTPMSPSRNGDLLKYAATVLETTGSTRVVTLLLSKELPLNENDIQIFSNVFKKNWDEQKLHEEDFETLIKTLNSMIGHSDLHQNFCSLTWNFAVNQGFSFASDPNFVNPSISLSPDALKEHVIAAVRNNDVEAFKMATEYSSIHPSEIMDHGKPLLHIALESATSPRRLLLNMKMIEVLIEAGCSFSQPDSEGRLPVHSWSLALDLDEDVDDDMDEDEDLYDDYEWPVEVFIDHGVTVNSQDSKGRNLLHINVGDDRRLSAFLRCENEANIAEALCMVDHEGYTPLSKALNEQRAVSASILFERGGNNPKTWQSPLSPLLLATRANSEKIFKDLLATGVALPATGGDTLTPLHYLGADTSIDFINYLKVLYPGACEARINDKIPLDIYIEQLFHKDDIQSTHIEALAALFPFELHSHEGGLVWEHFARNVIPAAYRSKDRKKEVSTKVVKELIRLGCLTSYETASHKPALLLLLEQLDSDFQSPGHHPPLTPESFCDILNDTCQWSGFQTGPLIISLLKSAVIFNKVALVRLLLEKGVPAHRRVRDESALEIGCDSRVKIDTFRLLLEYADKEQLDETNAAKNGLGLIHQLAHFDASDKVVELLRRGADANLRIARYPNQSAVVFHLQNTSHSTWTALLEHGADPTLVDQNNVDGCLMAAARGILKFLAKVLEMKAPSWQLDWKRRCNIIALTIGDKDLRFSGSSALHLASFSGNIDCLNFFINHDLLSNVSIADNDMLTPLHYAAFGGHANIIKYLHGMGANINARAVYGESPLHIAVHAARLAAVETLLDLGSHNTVNRNGKSSYLLACESRNQYIIDCFRKRGPQNGVQDASSSSNDFAAATIAEKTGLAIALEAAVRDCNMSLCKELRGRGCPLDIDLPSCKGCSPLLLAIREEKLDIVRWLLDNGASTLKANCPQCYNEPPIHEILRDKKAIHILPWFLERYMGDGGNLLNETDNPAGTAIENDNTEGLRILFGHLKQNIRHYAGMVGKHWTEATAMLANMPWISSKDNLMPPIHVAVSHGNLVALEYLLEYGADVNGLDDDLNTALHVIANSKSHNGEKSIGILIDHGAGLEFRDRRGFTPLMCASRKGHWDLAKALLDAGADLAVLDYLSGNVLRLSVSETSSGHKNSFAGFLALGLNPHHMDLYGVSPIQDAMCLNDFTVVFLNGDYGVQNTGPYPWRLFRQIRDLHWLTTKFPMFHRRIPLDDLRRIANTEPNNCWSPLCLSASQGVPMAIENLLTLGADLEFEGCPAGTALLAACSAGRLESVISLVRRGAAISYYGASGFRTAIDKTKTPPHIIHWLLVDRFTDQAKIKEEPHEGYSTSPLGIRPWSGITKAELIISEDLERRSDESSKDYWIYLMAQKKRWRGKVVPVVDRRRTVRPSNLVPIERVRIHPDGYEAPVPRRSRRTET